MGRVPAVLIAAVILSTIVAARLAAEEGLRAHPALTFGIFTPLGATTWPDLVATWQEAEALGFDSAWVNDHLAATPPGSENESQLEGWTALAALATYTSRMRVGVLVSGNTYRNPALLAKMATTVDQISGGRLILGIGAGWFEREHQAYGFEFGSVRQRAGKLAEALRVITDLWGERHPSFDGTYYSLHSAPYAPANVQLPRPPIIVGGQGKRLIVPLVARYADGWNANESVTPAGFRERVNIIGAECARIGRQPCPASFSKMLHLVTITRIPFAGPVIRFAARAVVDKEDTVSLLAGSPAAIAEHIQQYVEAGANDIVITLLPPYNRNHLQVLAREIIPRLRVSGSAGGSEREGHGKNAG
jgi:F420-dependent oxidoreductase-like protein